jgi:hypothetical protein
MIQNVALIVGNLRRYFEPNSDENEPHEVHIQGLKLLCILTLKNLNNLAFQLKKSILWGRHTNIFSRYTFKN